MENVSGTVTDSTDTAIEGATVAAVDTENGTVLATTTTAADGTYELVVDTTTTAHVFAQYDDGTQHNALSYPDLSVEPATTIIDDAESGTLSNRYGWHTSAYTYASDSSLEGSRLIEVDSTYQRVGGIVDDLLTPRGYRYEVHVSLGSSGDAMTLFAVQNDSTSTDPMTDCYAFMVDVGNSDIGFTRREGSGYNNGASHTGLSSLSAGTAYIQQIDYEATGGTDNITYRLLNDDRTPVTDDSNNDAVVTVTDDTWTGGWLGFYAATAGAGTQWDHIVQEPL